MRRSSSLLLTLIKSTKISPKTLVKPQISTNPLRFHLTQVHTWFYRSLCSSPEFTPSILPPRQRKIKEREELEETFESATTTDEIMSSFKELERTLDPFDSRLGLACLKVGQHLDSIGLEEHERVLGFGLRALKILESSEKNSISIAMALHLVGSACYDLKRFNDSLGFLNRANRIISSLEREKFGGFDIRPVSHAIHLQLANTKTAMGRREEALLNLSKCLEIKESILEPNSRELGNSYRDLAEAFAAVLNFKEALPLCLKALEIHQNQLGQNSVEVANDRRLLGVIYTGLEQHKKALEQNERSKKVLKNWGLNSELLHAEIDAANMQIALGKYEESIETLKNMVQNTEENSETRAFVYISMAKALSSQENANFEEVKKCLQNARQILGEKEFENPDRVSEAYVEIASLYESLNEFETAILVLKKSFDMIERLPHQQHLEGNVSAKIGWLLLLTGKVQESVPFLESAVERMKESFGPKHFGVGYIYNNLGAAFMEMGRFQSAAQMFAQAKDVLDLALGPQHVDSVEACQSLANAYSAMGSYALAMEFQKNVIDAWASHGPSAKDELKEATRLYEELKKKAFESLTGGVLMENNEEDSEDGSETESEGKKEANGVADRSEIFRQL
ncbi:hypothetical protein LUZ60_006900 [Juncus effusus]|nr:hypothetical protein LUZ60_006900 [Juncus effusus]